MNTPHSIIPTNSKEESTDDTAVFTSQAEHLQNSPVTKISPNKGRFPDTTGAEAEFNQLCNNLKSPVQMVLKKDIIWSKKDPLHFWQSLAFTLRSEELTCVAVSSFVDTQSQNKLYIASNDPMTASQQQEITEIINMFLDLKPVNEIATKLRPRKKIILFYFYLYLWNKIIYFVNIGIIGYILINPKIYTKIYLYTLSNVPAELILKKIKNDPSEICGCLLEANRKFRRW